MFLFVIEIDGKEILMSLALPVKKRNHQYIIAAIIIDRSSSFAEGTEGNVSKAVQVIVNPF
jgi:hypothetical protein